MARLKVKHLPHLVDALRLVGETAEGATWATIDVDLHAYVEQKSKLVIDRRSSSATKGQEIVSSTFVVMLTTDDVLPGSKVTVWKGTARERTSEVVDSALFEYAGTPSHVELRLE